MNAVIESGSSQLQAGEKMLSPEQRHEAALRLNQIRADLVSRFEGKELLKFLNYELQEIEAGRLNPDNAIVINKKDFETILTVDSPDKKEIRRIMGDIARRASNLLVISRKKAREAKLAARR